MLSIIENAMFFVLEYTGFCLGRSTSADNESSATLQFPTFQAESYLVVIPKICLRHLMLPFDLSFITILLEVQLKYITIGQNIRNTINLRIHIFVRCLLARHPPISKKRESKITRVIRQNFKQISCGSKGKEFYIDFIYSSQIYNINC